MVLPLLGLASLAIEAAPTIARWIGGDDAAEATEKVTNIAKAVTGAATANDAEAALKADPEKFMQFKQAVQQLDATLEQAYLQDRQDARARDIKLKQAGYHNYRADLMLAMAFLSFGFIVWLLATQTSMTAAVVAILNMAVGALMKMLGDGFAFEFGSSRGSKEKSAKLGES